ncbi:MAG: hypothetical protein AAB621_00625, partial [Patescibacteria group bacterium]
MKKEIAWRSPEFKYYHKEPSWYWINAIIAGSLFLIALYQKNILMAIFIAITELTIIMLAKRLPRTIEFKIDKDGIHFGKITFYSYEELTGFEIRKENDEVSELVLLTDSKINPTIKINIPVKNEEDIRNILKNFIDEVEYEDT